MNSPLPQPTATGVTIFPEDGEAHSDLHRIALFHPSALFCGLSPRRNAPLSQGKPVGQASANRHPATSISPTYPVTFPTTGYAPLLPPDKYPHRTDTRQPAFSRSAPGTFPHHRTCDLPDYPYRRRQASDTSSPESTPQAGTPQPDRRPKPSLRSVHRPRSPRVPKLRKR